MRSKSIRKPEAARKSKFLKETTARQSKLIEAIAEGEYYDETDSSYDSETLETETYTGTQTGSKRTEPF